jgi:hypothetical protein
MTDHTPSNNLNPAQLPPARRKFVIIEITGEPEMVDQYVSLMTMQAQEYVHFFRAMFTFGKKKAPKLPRVDVYERQAE